MNFLEELINEISVESKVSPLDEDIEHLKLLDYTIESRNDELTRGIALYTSVQEEVLRYESDTSFESASNYERNIELMVLASGLNIPTGLFVSMESEDKTKDVEPIKGDATATVDDKKDPKEADPKKKSTMKKAGETLKKIYDWIVQKTKEFGNWLVERAKRIGLMKEKVVKETEEIDAKLQEIK